MQVLELDADGLVGAFFPAASSEERPAVLVLHGSIPEAQTWTCEALAAAGFPSLALTYFGAEGLPASMTSIPLEYFESALAWLARQPGVDPRRLVAWGISRGSEAALLVAAAEPSAVAGVVALVPGNVVLCGLSRSDGSAWSRGGVPLPHATAFGPDAEDPDTVIPVERIDAPVLVVGADCDDVWPSAAMAQAIHDRRRSRRDLVTELLLYPEAGHNVGALPPLTDEALERFAGSSPTFEADQRGREAAWPRILRFIAEIPAT